MLKKIIKKTFLYKPLKAILKKLRKLKKNIILKKEEAKKLKEEKRRLREEKKEQQKRLKEEYLANLFTYEKAERIINERYSKKHDSQVVDFSNPLTYTEKLNYSKLYNPTKKKSLLTDKITVRDWIKKKIGEEYLVPIIAIYDSFENIDFKRLPKEYIIKCSHDSGSTNIIDKNHKLDKQELSKKFDYYLNRNLASYNYEMHYRDIKPHIIIEENLGANVEEYKFLCFNGKLYYIWQDFDNHTTRNVYDSNFNLLDIELTYPKNKERLKKPTKFEEMKKIVKKLSKGFDQVRVDLYDVDGKIYFNEMTFTSGNGMSSFKPSEIDLEIGKLWKLNTKKRKKLLHKELILEK